MKLISNISPFQVFSFDIQISYKLPFLEKREDCHIVLQMSTLQIFVKYEKNFQRKFFIEVHGFYKQKTFKRCQEIDLKYLAI